MGWLRWNRWNGSHIQPVSSVRLALLWWLWSNCLIRENIEELKGKMPVRSCCQDRAVNQCLSCEGWQHHLQNCSVWNHRAADPHPPTPAGLFCQLGTSGIRITSLHRKRFHNVLADYSQNLLNVTINNLSAHFLPRPGWPPAPFSLISPQHYITVASEVDQTHLKIPWTGRQTHTCRFRRQKEIHTWGCHWQVERHIYMYKFYT